MQHLFRQMPKRLWKWGKAKIQNALQESRGGAYRVLSSTSTSKDYVVRGRSVKFCWQIGSDYPGGRLSLCGKGVEKRKGAPNRAHPQLTDIEILLRLDSGDPAGGLRLWLPCRLKIAIQSCIRGVEDQVAIARKLRLRVSAHLVLVFWKRHQVLALGLKHFGSCLAENPVALFIE